MADFVAVESMKDALAECPICTEYFNDTSRIPRRMPCCLQAMCEPCLETYSQGRRSLCCPLCRQHNNLPGGVKSLPKEMLILRFLDVLKTQSNAVPSCTECPDKNTAITRCDTCSSYLCQSCLADHSRNRMSRNHKTTTFEEIKLLRSTRRSTTQTISQESASKVEEKLGNISKRIEALLVFDGNVEKSKKAASYQINSCFDELTDEIQQRRAILLSQVESKAAKERKSITRALAAHKALHLKLQKAQTGQQSSASLDALLNESPEDVGYAKMGVSFIQANIQQLTDMVKAAGQVRLVTYTLTKRPDCVPQTDMYNVIKQTPDVIAQGPLLEWDSNTASDDVTISGSVITNTRPDPPPPDTGCRIQTERKVLTSRPLVIRRRQRVMYHVKVRFSLKKAIPENRMLLESSMSSSPVDANWCHFDGLSVRVASCSKHEQQICLQVRYDNKRITDAPITKNQVGESSDLHLCFLLDGDNNKIHVLDVDAVRVNSSVTDAVFDRPLWLIMYVDSDTRSRTRVELLSSHKVPVSQKMAQLASSLH